MDVICVLLMAMAVSGLVILWRDELFNERKID